MDTFAISANVEDLVMCFPVREIAGILEEVDVTSLVDPEVIVVTSTEHVTVVHAILCLVRKHYGQAATETTYALDFPATRPSVLVDLEVIRVLPSLAVSYIGLFDGNVVSSTRSIDPAKLEEIHSPISKTSTVGGRSLDPVRLQACTILFCSALVDEDSGFANGRDGDDVRPEITVNVDQTNTGYVPDI